MSFARKIGDKYGEKLMDTATKTGEATEDLIGNKIADKITSIGKSKEKGKTKKVKEVYIPPDKKAAKTWDCFEHKMWFPLYKNGISKNCKFAWHDFWW